MNGPVPSSRSPISAFSNAFLNFLRAVCLCNYEYNVIKLKVEFLYFSLKVNSLNITTWGLRKKEVLLKIVCPKTRQKHDDIFF